MSHPNSHYFPLGVHGYHDRRGSLHLKCFPGHEETQPANHIAGFNQLIDSSPYKEKPRTFYIPDIV